MNKCIKCKQNGRFFDTNGLDFWYFVDLFGTISRVHEELLIIHQMKQLNS